MTRASFAVRLGARVGGSLDRRLRLAFGIGVLSRAEKPNDLHIAYKDPETGLLV